MDNGIIIVLANAAYVIWFFSFLLRIEAKLKERNT